MLALLEEGELHGYQIIRTLQDRIGGDYRPSAGTVYPRLRQLERDGLVAARDAAGRVFYRLTEAGRAELREQAAQIGELDAEVERIHHGIGSPLKADVRRSAQALREEMRAQAKALRNQDHTAPFGSDLQRELSRFSSEWGRLATSASNPEQARRALSAAIEAALRELRRSLTGSDSNP
ncbi:MAG TPA: PadR family transcriptional regulator [Candidatus Dormibacteraeota bacterium]|nr:PadR family transcriptional regulator [Candidatus Dormibacteraeota bacterium]